MSSKHEALITKHGEFWRRTKQNFAKIRSQQRDPFGVYALYNGLTPVYFGQGYIAERLTSHDKNRSMKKYWDHFSWYEVKRPGVVKDLETLLLRMLPVYLHMLNRQRGKFVNGKAKLKDGHSCELNKPKYGAGKKRSKHRG